MQPTRPPSAIWVSCLLPWASPASQVGFLIFCGPQASPQDGSEQREPGTSHSNPVHGCACAQVMQHNGEGGRERGGSPQPPACRGDYCMRAVGLWRRGMSMLPMAPSTRRDSGCGLVFLDSGKLWAFATFYASFFYQ